MPRLGSSCEERRLRVPNPSSFLSVAVIRSSETSETIFETCGLMDLYCAEAVSAPKHAARKMLPMVFIWVRCFRVLNGVECLPGPGCPPGFGRLISRTSASMCVCGCPEPAIRRSVFRLRRSGVLPVIAIHNALLHHEEHLFGLSNVHEGIAWYRDDVRKLSRLQSPGVGINTKQAGVD